MCILGQKKLRARLHKLPNYKDEFTASLGLLRASQGIDQEGVLYLKNWSGNIFKYLKNLGNPEPLSLTEPLSPAKTEPVPMSNEAIIADPEEDAPKGVALQEEANYLYALPLRSSLLPNI